MQLEDHLQQYFGFNQFRNGQKKVVEKIMAGESAGAVFPTGSGKSLCYQLPAVLLPHLTIVVSPLLALINDQLQFLRSKNIPATKIDSTLSRDEATAISEGLLQGKYKILFVSVERFKNERFRNFLHRLKLSMMVIDEAHCISEWGHNFRPDYMKLGQYREEFSIPQVLLLTATATGRVVSDMSTKFSFPKENIVSTGFYRPNLHISVSPTSISERRDRLFEELSLTPDECGIVYVTQHRTAEETAAYLKARGLSVEPFHAGIKSDERFAIQSRFMRGETKIIVATIAFGMGIDKSDIRNVIHFDLPKSIESYSQEIGRAGRDGSISKCTVLADSENRNVLENFVYGDTPQRSELMWILEQMKQAGEKWELRLYNLSRDSNIKQLPLKTLLVYLEAMGYISPQYTYFAEYRFKALKSPQEIVNQFDGERQEFIKAIFVHSDKARLWTTVNFGKIGKAYVCDRKRITTALEYFDEKGMISLETKNSTEVFAVLKSDFDVEKIADEIYTLFKNKEVGEVDRIDDLIKLFESKSCLTKELSHYFGENQDWENCGHCSACKGNVAELQSENSLAPLSSFDFTELTEDFIEKLKDRVEVDHIARFLCGISTPLIGRLRVKQLPGFSALANYRYGEIRGWVQEHLEK